MRLKALRHYALVSEMIGVEGLVTAELALMIVNLQSLGLSVALTSVPILASAMTSIVLIPLLGVITAKFAKTPKQKATSLIGVNSLQMLGVGIIIIANILRLLDDQNSMEINSNVINSSLGLTTLHPLFDRNESVSTLTPTNLPITHSPNDVDRNSSASSQLLEGQQPLQEEPGLKLYAILAIIGYIMADSGYDTGSCFLKTFALSSTPRRDHPDVIVRAIQMSSVGGILVTLLGSVGVGEVLAKGMDLNVNSVTTIFILTLMALLLIPSAILTLTTGLCCQDGLYDQGGEDEDVDRSKHEGTSEEKQSLITDSMASDGHSTLEDKINQWQISFSSIRNDDDVGSNYSPDNARGHRTVSNSLSRQSSISREVLGKIFQFSQSGAHSLMEEELNSAGLKSKEGERGCDFVEILDGEGQGCLGRLRQFLRHHKKRLTLLAGSFFALGALFSFNMYTVNFVTVSICDGDSNAPPGSEKYENYLNGIKIGSTGLLVFYASFVIGTTSQDLLLRRIGWWREASVMFVIYVTCTIVCATVKLEWFYYVTAFVTGLHRAMIFTVPYILVCRILTNNDGDPSKPNNKAENSGDIALVASMLPLSMIMVALVMGPIIELTGDTAAPIYFSGVSAFVGFLFFSLLRKY